MTDTETPDVEVIVAGIDGSDPSLVALDWAAEEARVRSALLEVVHVQEPTTAGWPLMVGDDLPPRDVAYERAARRLVDEAADVIRTRLGDRAPTIRTRVEVGEPVAGLVSAAAGRTLLVVGRRGLGLFGRLLIGSVADGVVHHAPTPVAVIGPADTADATDIVVGLDDSDGARAAFAWAADEAHRRGVKLVVVHGWDTPVAVPPGGLALQPLEPGTHQRHTDALVDRVIEERRAAGAPLPEIERRAVELTAPQALIGEAAGAALLVVGSRGRGGFAGLLLGSVSQQCLHHAPGSLVVVPAPSDDKRR